MRASWLSRPSCLLHLGSLKASTSLRNVLHAGLHSVPIRHIPGSEGRCEDFDVDFEWTITGGTYDSGWTDIGYEHTVSRSVPSPGAAVSYVFQVRAYKDIGSGQRLEDPTPATYAWTVVPPASPGDPGLPVGGGPLTDDEREIYGVDVYVDAPGEQPIKYIREQAK